MRKVLSRFSSIILIVFAVLSLAPINIGLAATDTQEDTYQIELPKLQIPMPTLEPFTQPFREVTPEGKTVVVIEFLAQYLRAFYKYAIGISGFIAGAMVIWAGIKWLTSGGSAEKITDAKHKMGGVAVGITLLFASYVLLYLVNPELVMFKPLRVEVVARIPLPLETRIDQNAGDAELPEVNCSAPGFVINSIDNVDMRFADAVRKYILPNKALYQQAAEKAGVPWEMIAANHYTEANGSVGKSVLNGGRLCNTQDDPTLLNWCQECSTPTVLNDLICGGKLLKKAVGALSPTTTDVQAIKLAFCKYGGCPSKWRQCPDASHMVSALFDANHQNYIKSGLDCISPNCNPNCTTDATISPKSPRGCCSVKVLPSGRPAPSGFSGSLCNTNQGSRLDSKNCVVAENENSKTYKYIPGERNQSNPCGSWIRQQRPGKFTIYAVLKKMSE